MFLLQQQNRGQEQYPQIANGIQQQLRRRASGGALTIGQTPTNPRNGLNMTPNFPGTNIINSTTAPTANTSTGGVQARRTTLARSRQLSGPSQTTSSQGSLPMLANRNYNRTSSEGSGMIPNDMPMGINRDSENQQQLMQQQSSNQTQGAANNFPSTAYGFNQRSSASSQLSQGPSQQQQPSTQQQQHHQHTGTNNGGQSLLQQLLSE